MYEWFTNRHYEVCFIVLVSISCFCCVCTLLFPLVSPVLWKENLIALGLITWARGQQPNLVKAFRQENSAGHRDWSGQTLSSSSPWLLLIILKDCRDRMGKGAILQQALAFNTYNSAVSCYSYFRGSGLICRSSFSPGNGHGSVHTAGRGHITDCFRRAAMCVILTALSLPG